MRYVIFQIKDIRNCDYAFRGWDEAKAMFDANDYVIVWCGDSEPGEKLKILEDLFMKFNIDHPTGFHGHSMSVSDVVALIEGRDLTIYYCDDFGWREIPWKGFL